jgi:hypothetical protein
VDLVFDMVMPSAFDFLSILNMSSLNSAATKCDEAAASLLSARASIEASALERRAAFENERTELLAIDRPYLLRATERVPDSLSFAVPDYLEEARPTPSSGPRP